MNINRDNYEMYFLDFAEGKLSAGKEEELRLFLRSHPELEEELRDIHTAKLSPEEIRFPGKRDINFEPVAYIEGDLSAKENELFEAKLQEDPVLRQEVELYRKVRLSASDVEYPFKASLKKPVTGVSYLNWRVLVPLAAAAAVALLIYIGIGNGRLVEEMASSDDLSQERVYGGTSGPVEDASEESVQDVPEQDIPEQSRTSENNRNASQSRPNQSGQAVIRVIKDSNSPVPVSTLNQTPSADITGTSDQEPKRFGVVNLDRNRAPSVEVPEPRLAGIQTPLPTINPRSLSVTQLARLQVSRINEIADQDEQLLVSLASAGISEINKRTGTNMRLLASTSEEGRVNGIEFRSRLFSLRTPIQAEEN